MRRTHLLGLSLAGCVLILVCCPAWAEEEHDPIKGTQSGLPEAAARLFNFKVPPGFQFQSSDEPGILKWKKESSEIYLVVGDLFALPAQTVFKQLVEAAEKNVELEKVQTLKIKGGHAFTYIEKPPKEPGRLRTLRLIVITDEKVINVDFSAPEKGFDSLIPEFEATIKSFKLVSSKS